MSKQNQERELIKRGRYALTDPDTGKPATFQRVTNFKDVLEDKSGLIDWTARHVVLGLAENDDLLVRASGLDIDDRGELDRIWKEAKDSSGGNRAANDGTLIHKITEDYDHGIDARVPVKWRPHLERYIRLLDEGPLEVVPEYIERVVCVPEIGVAGTFDRLYRMKRDLVVTFDNGRTVTVRKGELVVGDVKSSKTLIYSGLSFSVQFACYAKARHAWVVDEERWEDLPEINQEVAFVVWLPSTKGNAELVAVDLTEGMEAIELAARVRAKRTASRRVFSVVHQLPVSGDVDDGSFASRIKRAQSKKELSTIRKEALEVGFWTQQLQTLGLNRMKELEG